MFGSIIRKNIKHPDRILFCLDGKPKTDKNRKPKPDDYEVLFKEFIIYLKQIFGEGCCFLDEEIEADDLIARVARKENKIGNKVFIITGDKDLHQLNSLNTKIYSLSDKALLTEYQLCEKWGIHSSSQIGVVLALTGDASDGIDGVEGIGIKTVHKLFEDIPEDATIEETISIISNGLPPDKKLQFERSLKNTLLRSDIETTAEPIPFKIVHDIPSLDIPELNEFYYTVFPIKYDKQIDDWIP